jgi:putative phosphoesterase
MYIGLISDTHGKFCDDVKSFLKPVDQIWHAGDFGTLACAHEIAAFKPLVGVYGNCDGQDVRLEYPLYQTFVCEGLRILMTHIGLRRGSYWAYAPNKHVYDFDAKRLIDTIHPDVFVCGHTHIPQVFRDKEYDMLFMNPGACGTQGPVEVPRMAFRFKIESGKILAFEKCEFKR